MLDQRAVRTRSRAAVLPPDQRRAALIAATLSVLLADGPAVTTRQIAEAAGIAEGTIFRVFPDKDSLIAAAIEHAFDPAPVEAELRAIDATLPLEARLRAAVEILQCRFSYIGHLMIAVGRTRVPGAKWSNRDPRPSSTLSALAEVFEPDRGRLRCDPPKAAQLLRGLSFAGSHPSFILDEPLTADEIVAVLLDGLRVGAPAVDDQSVGAEPQC